MFRITYKVGDHSLAITREYRSQEFARIAYDAIREFCGSVALADSNGRILMIAAAI